MLDNEMEMPFWGGPTNGNNTLTVGRGSFPRRDSNENAVAGYPESSSRSAHDQSHALVSFVALSWRLLLQDAWISGRS